MGHNLSIFNQLSRFQSIGVQVMIGPSRKSFIGELTGAAIHDRLPGTIASVLHAYSQGVTVFRVHDVAPVIQALAVWDAMVKPYSINQMSPQRATQ
jgi:dihydropteroate synthase